jgi:hypothetical protein
MNKIEKATASDVLNVLRPSRETAFTKENQPWRDAFCVAKLCEIKGLEGLLTAPCDEPVDVHLDGNFGRINFQVVECKNPGRRGDPTDIPFQETVNEDGEIRLFSPPDLSLANDKAIEAIILAVKDKEAKYTALDMGNMVLLVYLNLYWLDPEDLILESVYDAVENSPFKSIVLLHDGTITMLKGRLG